MHCQSVHQYLAPLVLALGLAGCIDTGSEATGNNGSGGDNVGGDAVSGDDAPLSRTTSVNFDPANQVIPFPNNLLFEAADDAELDGTLNAPIDEDDPASAQLIEGLNDLNGFSTIAAWRLEFTNEVDESSLVAGETVRVFKLETEGDTYPARTRGTGVEKELVAGRDFEVEYLDGDGEGPYRIRIVPTRALAHDATYAAIITDGVRDTDGHRVASPIEWSVARGEGRLDECGNDTIDDEGFLQCMTNRAIAPVADADNGLDRGDMIMGWGVTTQREDVAFWNTVDHLEDSLRAVRSAYSEQYEDRELQLAHFLDVGSTGEDAPTTPGGKAVIWPGAVRLPVAIPAPEGLTDDGTPITRKPAMLTSHWECMPRPDINSQTLEFSADEGNTTSCGSDEALEKEYVARYPVPTEEEFANEDQRFRALQTVPAVMTVPDVPSEEIPEDGFPVVIFQHAIQQNRTNLLAIADVLAEQGYAAVAIDMPMHGMNLEEIESLPEDDPQSDLVDLHAVRLNEAAEEIEETTSSGFEGLIADVENLFQSMHERTYYLDLLDENGNAVEGGDGKVDPSGSHFLVPDQPLVQRDMMRQGALDLATLSFYLREGLFADTCVDAGLFNGITGTGCAETRLPEQLNTDEIHYVGHSVGNIVASPFLTRDASIKSVTMLAPTGGIMRTLENSPTIGPQLAEGLADAGLEPGKEDYYRFFNVVQSVLNGVEPLNHAPAIGKGADGDRPVYMAQVVGNDGSDGTATPSDADLVLPPSVDGSPTAGSTPLAEAMGLSHGPTGQDTTIGDGQSPVQTRVSFRYGDHSSFLLPLSEADEPAGNVAGFPYEGEGYDGNLDPNGEMQHQIGSFLHHLGQKLEIEDSDQVETQ